MSFEFGFYNAINHDREYSATQFGEMFDGLINDGVYSTIGNAFMTVPASGLAVTVKSGRAWFNKTWSVNTADYRLDLELADFLLPRIDTVVLEVDTRIAVRSNSLKVIKGGASTSPIPGILQSSDGLYQYPLAYVRVDANASSIKSSDIEIVVGRPPCPFVTGILQTADISDLYQNWEGQFSSWFSNVQSQLDGDIATNLQNQINNKVNIIDKATSTDLTEGTPNKWVSSDLLKHSISDSVYNIGDILLSERFLDKEVQTKWLKANGSSIPLSAEYQNLLNIIGAKNGITCSFLKTYSAITSDSLNTFNAKYMAALNDHVFYICGDAYPTTNKKNGYPKLYKINALTNSVTEHLIPSGITPYTNGYNTFEYSCCLVRYLGILYYVSISGNTSVNISTLNEEMTGIHTATCLINKKVDGVTNDINNSIVVGASGYNGKIYIATVHTYASGAFSTNEKLCIYEYIPGGNMTLYHTIQYSEFSQVVSIGTNMISIKAGNHLVIFDEYYMLFSDGSVIDIRDKRLYKPASLSPIKDMKRLSYCEKINAWVGFYTGGSDVRIIKRNGNPGNYNVSDAISNSVLTKYANDKLGYLLGTTSISSMGNFCIIKNQFFIYSFSSNSTAYHAIAIDPNKISSDPYAYKLGDPFIFQPFNAYASYINPASFSGSNGGYLDTYGDYLVGFVSNTIYLSKVSSVLLPKIDKGYVKYK